MEICCRRGTSELSLPTKSVVDSFRKGGSGFAYLDCAGTIDYNNKVLYIKNPVNNDEVKELISKGCAVALKYIPLANDYEFYVSEKAIKKMSATQKKLLSSAYVYGLEPKFPSMEVLTYQFGRFYAKPNSNYERVLELWSAALGYTDAEIKRDFLSMSYTVTVHNSTPIAPYTTDTGDEHISTSTMRVTTTKFSAVSDYEFELRDYAEDEMMEILAYLVPIGTQVMIYPGRIKGSLAPCMISKSYETRIQRRFASPIESLDLPITIDDMVIVCSNKGTGKTTKARMLVEKDYWVVDSDTYGELLTYILSKDPLFRTNMTQETFRQHLFEFNVTYGIFIHQYTSIQRPTSIFNLLSEELLETTAEQRVSYQAKVMSLANAIIPYLCNAVYGIDSFAKLVKGLHYTGDHVRPMILFAHSTIETQQIVFPTRNSLLCNIVEMFPPLVGVETRALENKVILSKLNADILLTCMHSENTLPTELGTPFPWLLRVLHARFGDTFTPKYGVKGIDLEISDEVVNDWGEEPSVL